mmetsp:Transcript_25726/g.57853  ORF Transcript_25726/g.57853 Transcript_25726/m.57853 type:complete len:210 (-) Transcript_25726:567-1196(-)
MGVVRIWRFDDLPSFRNVHKVLNVQMISFEPHCTHNLYVDEHPALIILVGCVEQVKLTADKVLSQLLRLAQKLLLILSLIGNRFVLGSLVWHFGVIDNPVVIIEASLCSNPIRSAQIRLCVLVVLEYVDFDRGLGREARSHIHRSVFVCPDLAENEFLLPVNIFSCLGLYLIAGEIGHNVHLRARMTFGCCASMTRWSLQELGPVSQHC